ncbi:uncharacterized protein LOC116337167 [Contarinia nasturtii]|uniref:uncharacterized protein LOC116337167 n=1 Tax=Contarinia nasturtii TaxID=265458 RepID=UPI0012D4C218|nr:uncharacterized protein LOC116337167 [Contarinia nasturtii]
MLNSLVFCIIFLVAVNGQNYDEQYRLQVHYSVKSAWSNDPNGLIYAGGYYHLFYQFYPNDIVWGPMHWGHARSKDLIHWENMPIALEPYDKWMIFSGCCVIDKSNVAGFLSDRSNNTDQTEDTLIAIFTLKELNGTEQSEGMAYSFDAGTTWTQYVNNPIIRIPGIVDFRDPMVFQRNGQFYMTLDLGDRIRFYSSTDLKTWKDEFDFGVNPDEGDKSGVWECPSMVTLKDEQGNEHDVLIVSVLAPEGCFAQYFVGKFTESHFNSYNQSKVALLDNGFDNYASVPYINDPLGRIILIGWMSNWLYSDKIPTSTWRGQYTIPRELTLKTIHGQIYLVQQPIRELNNLIDPLRTWSLSKPMKVSGFKTIDLTEEIPFVLASAYILDFEYDIGNVTQGNLSIRFSNSFDEFIAFRYDFSDNSIEFDRTNSGNFSFSSKLVKKEPRISNSNIFSGKVILDTSSVEKFVDGGLNVFTNLVFPAEPYNKIQLFTAFENAEESVTVSKLNVTCLNSIWK